MASVANQWSTQVITEMGLERALYIPPKTISEELAIKHIDSTSGNEINFVTITFHDKNSAKLFAKEYGIQEDSSGFKITPQEHLQFSEDKDFECGKKIFERLEQQGPIQPSKIRKTLQKFLDPLGYIKDNIKESYEEVREFVSTAHPRNPFALQKLTQFFIDNIPKEKAEARAVEQIKLQFKLLKGNEHEFPEFNKAVEFSKKYGPKIETLISIVQEYKKPGVLMLYADFLIGELHLANGNLEEAEKVFKEVNSIGTHPLQIAVQRLDDIATMRATSQTASVDEEEVDFPKIEAALKANLANRDRDPRITHSHAHLLMTGRRPGYSVTDFQEGGVRDITPDTIVFAMMEQMRITNENMRLMSSRLDRLEEENQKLRLENQQLKGQSPAQQPTGSPEPLILSKEPNKERKKDQETPAKPEAGKPEKKKPD